MEEIKVKPEDYKSVDVTKLGVADYRRLQQANNAGMDSPYAELLNKFNHAPVSQFDPLRHAQQDVASSFRQNETPTGKKDYWGRSMFDGESATEEQFQNLGDIRATNEPWYAKLGAGVGKAGVLAVTTFCEVAGLAYGLVQGTVDAANAESGDRLAAFGNGFWNNPLTRVFQTINDYAEEYLPNYYTKAEQEDPFGHIFTANFLGDKIIKNLGFMIGAFYSGNIIAKGIGKLGLRAAKSARAAYNAEKMGMAERVGTLKSQFSGEALDKALAAEHLTEAERGKRLLDGMDKIRNIAHTTRATTQTVGVISSAINEGAIEALNNSRDWAKEQTREVDDRYQQTIASIYGRYGNTPEATEEIAKASRQHEAELAEIERGKARMGNADLLLNLPILMASNAFQLGKLYSRGFNFANRSNSFWGKASHRLFGPGDRQVGSIWNGWKLEGNVADGTLHTAKNWKKGVLKAVLNPTTEGAEEYLQRSASDGAGNAVNEAIIRAMSAGNSEHAEASTWDYIANFGKAIAENLENPQAWEEFMVGAMSASFGMPVFGSATRNAYIGKGKAMGVAGGIVGEFNEYMDSKENEEKIADYLNKRVADPKFKALYNQLRSNMDYEGWMQDALENGDKQEYKTLEFEKLFSDIHYFSAAGLLEEFKNMVAYNKDYTDEDLNDIVTSTTTRTSAAQRKQEDMQYVQELTEALNKSTNPSEKIDLQEKIRVVNDRITKNEYQDTVEGPFIDRDGHQMNATDPEGMRRILKKNRDNILKTIDQYLKIRDDIDQETNGGLTDDQLTVLTKMRANIQNFELRSAEMAYDILTAIDDTLLDKRDRGDSMFQGTNILGRHKRFLDKIAEERKQSQEALAKDPNNQVLKEDAEKKEKAYKSATDVVEFLKVLAEGKKATTAEREADAVGYNQENPIEASGDKRFLNDEELSAYLANPANALTLSAAINALKGTISPAAQEVLTREIADLWILAKEKLTYNKKLREFLKDPTKINEAYQQEQDKLDAEAMDKKAQELAETILSAKNLRELAKILRDSSVVNSTVTEKALEIAKQKGNESFKNMVNEYEACTQYEDAMYKLVHQSNFDDLTKAGAIETIARSYETALDKNLHMLNDFKSEIETWTQMLYSEPNEQAKKTAKLLDEVVDKLNILDSSNPNTGNNRNYDDEGNNNPIDDTEESNEGSTNEGEEGSNEEGSNEGNEGNEGTEDEEESNEDTARPYDDIVNDIKKEIADAYAEGRTISISTELRNDVDAYNSVHSLENAINLNKLIDETVNDIIKNSTTSTDDAAIAPDVSVPGSDQSPKSNQNTNSGKTQRGVDMQEALNSSYKSDRVSRFNYAQSDVGCRGLYYPNTGNKEYDAKLEVLQNYLAELKAYDFVDGNILGYLSKVMEARMSNVEIHFLRSTDKKYSDSIFMAVEYGDKENSAIADKYFNGNAPKFANRVNTITLGGKSYQIVGVATFSQKANPKIQEAFGRFSKAFTEETDAIIKDLNDKGSEMPPFVISEKFSTQIKSMNTGVLDKTWNDGKSPAYQNAPKIPLSKLLDAPQQDPKNTRLTPVEEQSNMGFMFGVVAGTEVAMATDTKGVSYSTGSTEEEASYMVHPSSNYCELNAGAILMYVPKPDGMFYPIRCTRRTVGEWLANGGTDIFNARAAKPENSYIGAIIKHFKTLADPSKTWQDRMNAKAAISKFFILGKDCTISFDDSGVEVRLGNKSLILTYNAEDEAGFINELRKDIFADVLAPVTFTLPIHSSLTGAAIIKDDVFTTGLFSFFNFNSNFTVYPVDDNNETVLVENEPSPVFGAGNIRSTEVNFFGTDYQISNFNQADMKVYKKEKGKWVEASELESTVVVWAYKAERGMIPSFVQTFVDDITKDWDDIYKEDVAHTKRLALYNAIYKAYVNKGYDPSKLYTGIAGSNLYLYNGAVSDKSQALKRLNAAEQADFDKIGYDVFEEFMANEFKPSDKKNTPEVTEEEIGNGQQSQEELPEVPEGVYVQEAGSPVEGNTEETTESEVIAPEQNKEEENKPSEKGEVPSEKVGQNRFSGKAFDELDATSGDDIENLLTIKKFKSKKQRLYEVLQNVDEQQIVDHKDRIIEVLSLDKITDADIDKLINEIKGCKL